MASGMLLRALAVVFCASAAAAFGAAQEAKGITAYQERIEVAEDGSAKVAIILTAAGWTADSIELPLNVAKAKGFSAEAGSGPVTAGSVKVGDVSLLKVELDHAPVGKLQLKVAFTADGFFNWQKRAHGVYPVSYTFTNTTHTNISNYELKILLPAGYKMNGVTSSTPRATGEDVMPPYEFATEDARLAVNLRSKSVGPGKTAAIAFGVVQSGGNPLPLISIGLVIALIALYLKRDVLTREDYVREVTV